MRALVGLRALMILLVALLLPIEQARCALTSLPFISEAVETDHHDAVEHGHSHDSSTVPAPGDQTDPCCCAGLSLPTAAAPATISLPMPGTDSTPLATISTAAPAPGAFTTSSVAARSRAGPPADPSSTPQSPRSPPHSA